MDAGGNLSNTVTADSTESAPATSTLNIPVVQSPAIDVVKSSTTTVGDRRRPGGAVHVHGHEHRQHDADRDHGLRPEVRAAPTVSSGDTNADAKLQRTETWVTAAAGR